MKSPDSKIDTLMNMVRLWMKCSKMFQAVFVPATKSEIVAPQQDSIEQILLACLRDQSKVDF